MSHFAYILVYIINRIVFKPPWNFLILFGANSLNSADVPLEKQQTNASHYNCHSYIIIIRGLLHIKYYL